MANKNIHHRSKVIPFVVTHKISHTIKTKITQIHVRTREKNVELEIDNVRCRKYFVQNDGLILVFINLISIDILFEMVSSHNTFGSCN